MKKLFFLLCSCCCALSVFAQSNYGVRFSSLLSDDLTLENAIRLGLENNSQFLTARQDITIAEQRLSEAKLRHLPQFALQGTASWYRADSAMVLPEAGISRLLPSSSSLDHDSFYGVGVTATQYLYSGGRINGTVKLARTNLKQAQSRYETVKNAVVLDIKISFARLLYAQENAALTERLYKAVKKWYLSQDGWTRVRQIALQAQLQAAANEAQNELTNARLAMLVSLNKETNAPLTISGSFDPVQVQGDLPHFELWATEFRPELKSAIYALELDSIAIDLALSKRYPDVLINATYERIGDKDLDDRNKQVSLAVRLPLPYTFSQQMTQKKAQQRKSTLRRASIEDEIRVQVTQSYGQMAFWQQEVLTRQETYKTLSQLVEQNLKTLPKSGVSALEALQNYLQTAQSYLQALRENHTAKARLEWAIGKDL